MPKAFKPNPELEALAIHELPTPLHECLEAIRAGITALKTEAKDWGVDREFTPDGRFLGDVGELIARLFFGVVLNGTQTKGHDATTAEADGIAVKKGQKVEVKLRSRSTLIEFSAKDPIILVIYVSPETLRWGIVCNGPGEKLLSAAKLNSKGKFQTDCSKLRAAQVALFPSDPRLQQLTPKRA